ncbi:MAG: protoheme IX farnesyltransferase [Nitrosomonadales bacterium]|nr:protoheme IX farnesyltransferase [Nitrosomonadales bacterium]
MGAAIKQVTDLFKLRIGIVISFTALAGVAVTPGTLAGWKIVLLGLAVLISSASAGAFNQYVERDIDVRMARTRKRPFVTGTLRHGPFWLCVILTMLAGSVSAAAVALNATSALFVFLGAFFYAVVYTVWLKRRTWMNIVIGGLAGSFAVLAGAAAVNPELSSQALVLAAILFLWTPPHFWSLAIAYHKDYDAAKVPMLPVVVGDERAARVIFGSTVLLVATSLTPVFFGMGWLYFAGAAIGGAYFLSKSVKLARAPSRATAMSCFHASLMQLTLLLVSAMLDASV